MKFIKELIPYIVIILVVVLIRSFIITPCRVDGDSMETTLQNGNIMLLFKRAKIDRFDIVVINTKKNKDPLIKRVYGLPGETIETKNGVIYINDEALDDPYAYHALDNVTVIEKRTLKDDEYFCLGDNRDISKDSRILGAFTKKEIEGQVVYRLFPFNKFGSV